MAFSRPAHQRVTRTVGRRRKIQGSSLEGNEDLLQLSRTPRSERGVCFVKGRVSRSSALAALCCPLFTMSIAKSKVFHRAVCVPAPQMLRNRMFQGGSLVRSPSPNNASTRLVGVAAFFERFSWLRQNPVSRASLPSPPQRQ